MLFFKGRGEGEQKQKKQETRNYFLTVKLLKKSKQESVND